MRFRDAPIRRKLMTVILGTSGAVLLVTCAGFIGYEALTYRQTAVRELSTLGEIIAAQSTGAVAFDNQHDAMEILSALKTQRHIVAACLYDRAGHLFAYYPADKPETAFPAQPLADGYRFTGGMLVGCVPLVQVEGSERLGTLYLSSDMEAMHNRLRLYGSIALLVIVISSTVAYLLSRFLQRQISMPILALADTAKAVSARRDYSVRAPHPSADELGLLTDAFNHMLSKIQEQNAELEKRVRERTAELEAANNELEAFCSSAAHDLRTPLRAISGFTDLLLDSRSEELPDRAKHYVCMIRDGSGQMGQLIQDLLSFSRLGRQELSREWVDVEQACRTALQSLAADFAKREVEFRIGPLPQMYADPALLRVVLVNLLSNALKYSRPRKPAIIEVGTAAERSGTQPVVFVRDNGVGFDMKNSAKLFGVFQRLHHAHEFEGTGVGLATVRRIVERHGGQIWAVAVPDEGATFYFTLPAP